MKLCLCVSVVNRLSVLRLVKAGRGLLADLAEPEPRAVALDGVRRALYLRGLVEAGRLAAVLPFNPARDVLEGDARAAQPHAPLHRGEELGRAVVERDRRVVRVVEAAVGPDLVH